MRDYSPVDRWLIDHDTCLFWHDNGLLCIVNRFLHGTWIYIIVLMKLAVVSSSSSRKVLSEVSSNHVTALSYPQSLNSSCQRTKKNSCCFTYTHCRCFICLKILMLNANMLWVLRLTAIMHLLQHVYNNTRFRCSFGTLPTMCTFVVCYNWPMQYSKQKPC